MVSINRVTKVVKGGKNLSFSALVVVGDGHGVVGYGVGKAKEVPSAIKKGIEAAKKNLIRVPLRGHDDSASRRRATSDPARCCSKPAPDGTGIIAGGAVRAVVESCGVTNVLTKSLGSANAHNVVRAAFTALQMLRDPNEVARLRGKDLAELFPSRVSGASRHAAADAAAAAGTPTAGGVSVAMAGRRATTRKLKITLVKSPIGFNEKQARVVRELGLRRIRHSVELADTPEVRGMIHKVRHLVEVAE